MTWNYDESTQIGGRFKVTVGRYGEGAIDVTYVRGIPTQIESYTFGDPFGDATAVLQFPSVTGFDDIDGRSGTGIGSWLQDYAEVIIYWIPQASSGHIINPISEQHTAADGAPQQIWRGFIASIEVSDSGEGVTANCQGLLFQLDRYIQKPYYPSNPQAMEFLIAQTFDGNLRPALRHKWLPIEYPAGWGLKANSGAKAPYQLEGVQPGQNWSGYASRSTGSWDRALTGYVQDLLSMMYVPDEANVLEGCQWTVMPHTNPGINSYSLQVRDFHRPADFTLTYGQPGAKFRLMRDTGPVANMIFGDGVGFDGVVWRNAYISNDGERTDYEPLAAIKQVYPVNYTNENLIYNPSYWVNEQLYKYGSGFDLDTAIGSAKKSLSRDVDPGWNGSLDLEADPSSTMNKWQVRAGMTVLVKNIMGTGENGMRFHIADVQTSPMSGTVSMKLDTRYRDLLNLEESQVRTRDPLTPAKMLQVNRLSGILEDILAPWDYGAGSGYVPKASTQYFREMTRDAKQEKYPWRKWVKGSNSAGKSNRPAHSQEFFVRVDANSTKRAKRWTIVPVRLSQKGTIRLTQIAAFKANGDMALCPFHVSIYDRKLTAMKMPRDKGGPSPFITSAFESIDPNTGLPWKASKGVVQLAPPEGFIIGWGNKEQKAGYSPGRSSDGHHPTGMLYDEATWQWDFTMRSDFKRTAGAKQKQAALSVYVAFYAEYTEDVFFLGRFYRQEPGGF